MSPRRTLRLAPLALAILCCSCASIPTGPANPPMRVDAGPIAAYALDGAYDRFAASHGFMLVTYGGRLVAISALCTNDRTVLKRSADGFTCPADGSEFTQSGNPNGGPARDPLLRYVMWIDSNRHVYVDTSKPLIAPLWGRTDAYLIVPR